MDLKDFLQHMTKNQEPKYIVAERIPVKFDWQMAIKELRETKDELMKTVDRLENLKNKSDALKGYLFGLIQKDLNRYENMRLSEDFNCIEILKTKTD